MAEKYPFMPLEYTRLESDQAVRLMDPTQFGCFMRLLITCWHEGSIPDNLDEIEILSTYRGSDFRAQIWPCMKDKFYSKGEGRLHNKIVDEKRQEIKDKKDRQSAGGRKTAEKRWGMDSLANSSPNSLATNKKSLSGNQSESEPDSESDSKSKSELTDSRNQGPEDFKTNPEDVLKIFKIKKPAYVFSHKDKAKYIGILAALCRHSKEELSRKYAMLEFREKDSAQKPPAYFLSAVYREIAGQEHEKLKNAPVAPAIKNLIESVINKNNKPAQSEPQTTGV